MQTENASLRPSRSSTKTKAHERRQESGKKLVARLKRLCSSFPEFKSALSESVELVTAEITRNPEGDRELILHAIHCGAWTMDELKEESGLTRLAIQKILDELERAGIIVRSVRKESENSLGGRPKILWIPTPVAPILPPRDTWSPLRTAVDDSHEYVLDSPSP